MTSTLLEQRLHREEGYPHDKAAYVQSAFLASNNPVQESLKLKDVTL